MAYQAVAPYEQYFDTDGSPLDAGYLFFGVENDNPETAPVTVYWDEAGTQPAAQPIRTLNGYPSRAGSPAALYCNSAYSITLRNRRRALIAYRSSQTSDLMRLGNSVSADQGASLVGYKLNATGSVGRTLAAKMLERVSVKDFGAAGDGVTDDTSSIQAAVTYAQSAGKALYFPSGKYKTTASINVTAPLNIHGDDPQIPTTALADPTEGTWFYFAHNGIGINCTAVKGFRLSRVGTYRPTQVKPVAGAGSYTPTVQQADVYMNTSNMPVVEDVVLLNPYVGIQYQGITTGQGGGGMLCHNIRGTPLNRGIIVNDSYDCCHIFNVHFWPFWSGTAQYTYWQYQLTNLVALSLGRADNPVVDRFFSIFHNVGIEFFAGANGVTSKFQGGAIDLDRGQTGVLFSADSVTAYFDNLVAQGETTVIAGNGTGVRVNANNCDVHVGILNLVNFGQYGVEIATGKSGCALTVDDLYIKGYALTTGSTANAVYAAAGNTVYLHQVQALSPGGSSGGIYNCTHGSPGWRTDIVTGSRANATTYTNTKPRPLYVEMFGQVGGSTTNVTYAVEGAQRGAATVSANGYHAFSFMVPPGGTYRVDNFVSVTSWIER